MGHENIHKGPVYGSKLTDATDNWRRSSRFIGTRDFGRGRRGSMDSHILQRKTVDDLEKDPRLKLTRNCIEYKDRHRYI